MISYKIAAIIVVEHVTLSYKEVLTNSGDVWITCGAHGRSVVKPYKSVILILLCPGELFGNVAVAFICDLLGRIMNVDN